MIILTSMLFASILRQDPDPFSAARQALTQNITELKVPGALPGRVMADGARSFVFLTGNADGGRAPVAVAAYAGEGRAIALGHGAFCAAGTFTTPSNLAFTENTLAWLGSKPLSKLRVGCIGGTDLGDLAKKDGFEIVTFGRNELARNASSIDVLILHQGELDDDAPDQAVVTSFVKSGHGLLVDGPAWGWQQLNPHRDLRTQHTGNQILLPMGIGFTGDTVDGPYSSEGIADPSLTTAGALHVIDSPASTKTQSAQASASLQAQLTLSAPASNPLKTKIEERAAAEGTLGGPTPLKPFTLKTPYSRLKARLDAQTYAALKPEEVHADPSSTAFPGIPPATTKRISRVLSVDCTTPDWHSTGLFAPAGEVIEIQLPPQVAQAGISVRIGSHTDELWDTEKWNRFPTISRSWPLNAPTTRIASPFGGLIYIEVPEHLPFGIQPIKVSGAVMAPLYVLGKTSNQEWQKMIETTGSPWAELQGHLVTLTVPTHSAKIATAPDRLMKHWDQVLAACYKFFAAPKRPRQERYCTDVQISAGYMHSGYPIMTFLDVADTFCDLAKLTAKGGPTWGFYHEMGHNFQQSDWTWDGTGEVTNNLFSLFGCEQFNGATPPDFKIAHPAMGLEERQTRLAKYLAKGAPYSQWTDDPFLALTLFAQLRIDFGWQPFTDVFAEYEHLSKDAHPKTDIEKRDQWMVRFSRRVKRNLAPYFQKWGVPTSESARNSISNLPPYPGDQWPKT